MANPASALDLTPLWQISLDARIRECALAAEARSLIVIAGGSALFVIDQNGNRLAARRIEGELRAAAISADGATVVTVEAANELADSRVTWRDAELGIVDQCTLPAGAVRVAVDSEGGCAAIALPHRIVAIDRKGTEICSAPSEAAIAALAIAMTRRRLIALEATGKLVACGANGERVWESETAPSASGRALFWDSADDEAWIADGRQAVQRFDVRGRPLRTLAMDVAIQRVVATTRSERLLGITTDGNLVFATIDSDRTLELPVDLDIVDVAIEPLGRFGYYAAARGVVGCVDLEIVAKLWKSAPRRPLAAIPLSDASNAATVQVDDVKRVMAPTPTHRLALDTEETSPSAPSTQARVWSAGADLNESVAAVCAEPTRLAVLTADCALHLFDPTRDDPVEAQRVVAFDAGAPSRLMATMSQVAVVTPSAILGYDVAVDKRWTAHDTLREVSLASWCGTERIIAVQDGDRLTCCARDGTIAWTAMVHERVTSVAGFSRGAAIATGTRINWYDNEGGLVLSQPFALAPLVAGGRDTILVTGSDRVARRYDAEGALLWEDEIAIVPERVTTFGDHVAILDSQNQVAIVTDDGRVVYDRPNTGVASTYLTGGQSLFRVDVERAQLRVTSLNNELIFEREFGLAPEWVATGESAFGVGTEDTIYWVSISHRRE